jgi:predicted ATPase
LALSLDSFWQLQEPVRVVQVPFLSLVLFEGAGRNILIIDEPEISLNIAWQRELLTLFGNLIPDTQIIVASHSPALVKGNPSYLTELVLGGEI